MSENETRHERFKRLATMRTKTILDRIRVLGNCSNAQLYEYADDEINKIFGAIEQATKETKAKFKSSKRNDFKL
jgi:hypothetical protein